MKTVRDCACKTGQDDPKIEAANNNDKTFAPSLIPENCSWTA